MNNYAELDELTFDTMFNVMQCGIWLLNDLEDYLRPLNMSQARLTVLLLILDSEDGIVSPGKAAGITGKSRPGISRIIDKLSENGLIDILQNAQDGRGKKLQLTEKGRNLLEKIIPEYNRRISSISAGLNTEEKRGINKLLGKIRFSDPLKVLRGLDELHRDI